MSRLLELSTLSANQMAPKRKNDSGQEEQSARDRKKQKMAMARTIAVQPAQPENAVAGPSSSKGPDSKFEYHVFNLIPKKIQVCLAYRVLLM